MIREEVKEKGVTLISLVVTIVVLLILSGITISLVFSDNGIIAKTKEAKNKTEKTIQKEQSGLNQLYNDLEGALNNVPSEPVIPKPPLPSDGSYSEEKGVNTPNLGAEMTPIKWDGTKNAWVETNGSDPEWYDYTAKKWANAVIGGTFKEDGTLDESAIGYSMFVWIPRYAYSITSGYHQSGADINPTTPAEGVGTIEIEFMKGTSNEGAIGKNIVSYETAKVNAETTHKFVDGNYVIHPAFNYGQTVSGLWVAKFEASSKEGNSNSSSGDNVTTKTVQVKPGVESWRNIDIGNIYTNCLNYDSNTLGNANLNSHMMKNDEWGAVAYLSKSKYGKNAEVDKNSNSSYYTGGESGNAYVGNVGQSTTGTVHGVYDMSGGTYEYVAAYVNNGNSGLGIGQSLVNGDAKTNNVYSKASSESGINNYNANSSKYGDAVYETSTNGDSNNGSWYDDYSHFPRTSGPFFRRGGDYDDGSDVGVFFFDNSSGSSRNYSSFRPVLVTLYM